MPEEIYKVQRDIVNALEVADSTLGVRFWLHHAIHDLSKFFEQLEKKRK